MEPPQILVFRGSTSRNKVSVGEPADGSLLVISSDVSHERYYSTTCFVYQINPYYNKPNNLKRKSDFIIRVVFNIYNQIRLLTMDILGFVTMKSVAKCDK